MPTKEPGYVYILTNPSFKEDWVKIGKSSRPVDVRSKELDNTAVPLPFEIYATLKTTKYNEVEKLVHKTIDRLTDLRIRQNREFFNVRPGVALEILRDIASALEDAEIDTYNHGNIIHMAGGDAKTDLEKASVVRTQKNRFWQGYIEKMRQSEAFKEHFKLHESLPRHSYDLSLGTSACNIYQVATRKKLTIGIYFHGKDLFLKLADYRSEIEKAVGTVTDWTEYEKDSSIFLSKDFSLDDESNYDEAYAWLLEYAVRFKLAFMLGMDCAQSGKAQNDDNSDDTCENSPTDIRHEKRPRFRFSMVNIPVGEELIFIPTGIKVMVASDDQIEYDGRIYKLSPFVGTFMPEELRNASGAYQGAKYFTYKGEVLDDIRTRFETEGA